MNKLIFPVIVIILVAGGAAGWTVLNKPTEIKIAKSQPQAVKPTLAEQPVKSTGIMTAEPTLNPNEPIEYVNPSVVIDAINTSIPAKTYADLLPLMEPQVNLILYASSCCGTLTKAKAVSQLSYLNNATGPWNFSETNPIAAKLETEDPDHFKDMWIGTSADGYAVGFDWNDKFLITRISMTNNYKLITGN